MTIKQDKGNLNCLAKLNYTAFLAWPGLAADDAACFIPVQQRRIESRQLLKRNMTVNQFVFFTAMKEVSIAMGSTKLSNNF